MFQSAMSKAHDAIAAELDKLGNADGKFSADDIKAAAAKAEAELKAKQTNWFVGCLVALAAYGGGVVSALVLFCRHAS